MTDERASEAQDQGPRSGGRAAWRKGDAVSISGNYHYRAFTEGFVVQRFWHRQKFTLIKKTAPPQPGARALDVGCGSGVVADFLAQQGAIVDAVDCNEEAIQFARRQFPRENLDFHLGFANEMTFPDGTFHHVYCMEVIEHMAAQQAADLLNHLRRLMTPDGRLLVTTPNYLSLWPVIEFAMDVFHLSPRMRGKQHVCKFHMGGLRRMLSDAGFEVQRCGRMSGVAPFTSVVSWALAEWLDSIEWRIGNPLGNILYAVAGKAPQRVQTTSRGMAP